MLAHTTSVDGSVYVFGSAGGERGRFRYDGKRQRRKHRILEAEQAVIGPELDNPRARARQHVYPGDGEETRRSIITDDPTRKQVLIENSRGREVSKAMAKNAKMKIFKGVALVTGAS